MNMGSTSYIRVKRVYEAPAPEDGQRVLVDRLWPRGVSKQKVALSLWAREAAPSDELRREFHHDPVRWKEFRQRYWTELDAHPQVWKPILELARSGAVTLLYAARDTEHNNAAALKEYLMSKLAGRARPRPACSGRRAGRAATRAEERE
jgi:uncharacterized protein YeaO (DUF488 family)